MDPIYKSVFLQVVDIVCQILSLLGISTEVSEDRRDKNSDEVYHDEHRDRHLADDPFEHHLTDEYEEDGRYYFEWDEEIEDIEERTET